MNFLRVFLFLLLFTVCVDDINAQIISISKNGDVHANVLADETENGEGRKSSFLDSLLELVSGDLPISLKRSNGKVSLELLTTTGTKEYDVTQVDERIIEFEDRPDVRNLYLAKNDYGFVVGQGVFKASTTYQVNVDPEKAKITLLTPTGYKFLKVRPHEAVNVLVRSKIANRLKEENSMSIAEDETGNLYYQIKAFKDIRISDLYTYESEITAKVSAVNGDVLMVDETILSKLLSFIFS